MPYIPAARSPSEADAHEHPCVFAYPRQAHVLLIQNASKRHVPFRLPSRPPRLALDEAALAAASKPALSPGDASALAKKLNSDFTFIVTGKHGRLRSMFDVRTT